MEGSAESASGKCHATVGLEMIEAHGFENIALGLPPGNEAGREIVGGSMLGDERVRAERQPSEQEQRSCDLQFHNTVRSGWPPPDPRESAVNPAARSFCARQEGDNAGAARLHPRPARC